MRTLAQFAETIRRDVERQGWVEVSWLVLQDEIAHWAVDDFTNACLLFNGQRGAGPKETYDEFLRLVGYPAIVEPETRRIRFARPVAKPTLDLQARAR